MVPLLARTRRMMAPESTGRITVPATSTGTLASSMLTSSQSLLELTRWLMETYRLDTDQIIRRYDVTGKECPRFFVQNPDAWENFLAELAEKS